MIPPAFMGGVKSPKMPPSISMALAAARQASAIGAYAQKQAQPPPPTHTEASSQPVTPAKAPGTGLLVDKRI